MRTKPKPKQPRNTFVLELLVKQLARDVPGFKYETPQDQAALASMVWNGPSKKRQHTVHDGYMSFHHTDLASQFGGRFKAINARLDFLEVKKNEQDGKDAWRWAAPGKTTGVFTKGYRFSPVVQYSRDAFLAKKAVRLSRLLDGSGKVIRKLGTAVASLDTEGMPTTRWRVANDGDRMTVVPVDIPSLRKFQQQYSKDIGTWEQTGRAPPGDLFMNCPSLESLLVMRDKTAEVIRMALTEAAGRGNVPHRYAESPSGRLYADGCGSLQNAPKEIRKAALVGLWDYDISNCHFAILAQMARRVDCQCVAIEHYMAHTKAVRAEIANAIGISIAQTKTCLLAVMYGSRVTTWDEAAIPEAIGADKAALLYALPRFAYIAKEVKLARAAILKQHKPNRKGGLVNAFEKSIKADEHTPAQQLAHLVQGVEALALRACVERHPAEIVLLQHDGFTATEWLDGAALERDIQAATGYVLKLEVDLVQPDLSDQYAKAREKESKNELLKVRKARRANAGAGSSHSDHPQKTVSTAVPSFLPLLPPSPSLPALSSASLAVEAYAAKNGARP